MGGSSVIFQLLFGVYQLIAGCILIVVQIGQFQVRNLLDFTPVCENALFSDSVGVFLARLVEIGVCYEDLLSWIRIYDIILI